MKIGRIIHPKEIRLDCVKIANVFASYQILLPEDTIVYAWEKYSKKNGSEWITIPESDEAIYLAIIEQLDVYEW